VNCAASRLDGLRGEMDAIGAALERDDLDALPGMIDQYDAGVRAFCALPEARSLLPAVRTLHALQQATIGRMQVRKAQLQDLVRQQRHSSRAASAYASAGTR
jgi:hypothetical protein